MKDNEQANTPGGASDTTSTSRIAAIDLVRGTAVVFLPLVHCLYMYGNREVLKGSWFGMAMRVVGSFTPVFLFVMGISFTFSRDQSLLGATKRGLTLLALGYIMATLEFALPVYMGTMPSSFIKAYDWTAPLTRDQYLHLMTTGDILHVAGISLIFVGLACNWSKSPYVMSGIALGIAGLSGIIVGYRPGVPVVDGVADLLWGEEWNVFFPFVPWGAVVFLGIAFGLYMQGHNGNYAPAFRLMIHAGAVLLAVGGALCLYRPDVHYRQFFHAGPGGGLLFMGMSAMSLGLVQRIEGQILPTLWGKLCVYCSRRVTALYLVHWLIISWGMSVVGFRNRGMAEVVGLSFIVLALMFLIEAAIRNGRRYLSRYIIRLAGRARSSFNERVVQ